MHMTPAYMMEAVIAAMETTAITPFSTASRVSGSFLTIFSLKISSIVFHLFAEMRFRFSDLIFFIIPHRALHFNLLL